MTEHNAKVRAIGEDASSATLRRVIDRSATRHKLNLLFVLWPPINQLLECIAARICTEAPSGQQEDLISRSIMAGLKAADNVKGYCEPAWPMRVVDAFMTAAQEFIAQRFPAPCGTPGNVMCGLQPYCRTETKAELKKSGKTTGDVKLTAVPGRHKE